MLLAIDIGNTNVTVGAFVGSQLKRMWRLETSATRTADEYGSLLTGFLGREAAGSAVDGVAIGSVVPDLTPTFKTVARRLFKQEALVVDHTLRLGIRYAVDLPAEVGADRILNSLAAFKIYGAPAVVLDFGTATTF